MSSAGVIAGTPRSTGTFSFNVQVQDSATPPRTAAQALSIRIGTRLDILTTSLPDGMVGTAYSFNIVITGGGPGPFPSILTSGALPPGVSLAASGALISGTPTAAGVFSFTVQIQDSASPPRTSSRALVLRVSNTLAITTTSLPAGTVLAAYSAVLSATGGIAPLSWSVPSASDGAALTSAGLALNSASGEISGTLSPLPGSVSFTVQVMDTASPARTDRMSFRITLAPATGAGRLGRNDTIGNATPLSNGTYRASISPLVDPPGLTTANPDIDVYKLQASGGAIVAVEITAQRLTPSSFLDSVIEITDGIGPDPGSRLTTCRSPGSTTGLFNEPCVNDDIGFFTTDSRLEFQVPAGPALTFYVRVLDFRGDARPDFVYTISITGAN